MKYKFILLSTILFMGCGGTHFYSSRYAGISFWEYDEIGVLNYTQGVFSNGYGYFFYEKDKLDDKKYTLSSKNKIQSVIKVYKGDNNSEFIDLKVLAINEKSINFFSYTVDGVDCITKDVCYTVNVFVNGNRHEINTKKINHIYLKKDSLFNNKDTINVNFNIDNKYKQTINMDKSVNKILYLNALNDFSTEISDIYRINNNLIRLNDVKSNFKRIKVKNIEKKMIQNFTDVE